MDLFFALFNASKIGGYARGLVAAGLAAVVMKYPLLNDVFTPAVDTALETAAVGMAIGIWSHLAKAYSSPAAIAGYGANGAVKNIAGIFLVIAALGVGADDARAQMATKAPPAVSIFDTSACSATHCSGPYIGTAIANGIIVGVAGDQYWNNSAFLGVEIGAGAQVYSDPALTQQTNGFFSYQIMKAGGTVAGILGNTPAAPSNFPTVVANIISPYGFSGAVERNISSVGTVTGWTVGGGIEADVSKHSFIDVKYFYNNYGENKLPSETIIMAGWNYKF